MTAQPLSTDPTERLAQLEEKIAQAYQVISALLLDEASAGVLDYFSREVFDPEFLPWDGDDPQGHGVVLRNGGAPNRK